MALKPIGTRYITKLVCDFCSHIYKMKLAYQQNMKVKKSLIHVLFVT